MATESRFQTVWITGKRRSGTTWLAHLLATHPRSVYKHEIFLPNKRALYASWCHDLAGSSEEDLRARFDAMCRSAHVGVDEPMPAQPRMRPIPSRLL